MSLSNASKDPVDDDDGKSAKQTDDQRDRLGKNLLSIGDAVIVTDALGNVILLHPAAESLTGWTDYDARNRSIEAVFQIIHEVTRQPVIQPVKEVIEHGIVRNLAQFTLLVAKNGSGRSDRSTTVRPRSATRRGTWTRSSSSSGTPPSAGAWKSSARKTGATARSSSQSCRTPSSSSTGTCGSGRPIVRSMRPSTLHRKRGKTGPSSTLATASGTSTGCGRS